jgi:hypothetical protein
VAPLSVTCDHHASLLVTLRTRLAHFFQIELTLDAVQDLVVDHAAIAQSDHQVTLGPQRLAPQALIAGGLGGVIVIALVVTIECCCW